MVNAVITGSGHFLPPNVVRNDYFLDYEFYDEQGNRIDKSNEEIIAKLKEITEIEERRYANPEMRNSEMAAIAAERAIENAGIDKETLDYVMVATNYGDIDPVTQKVDIMPSISARVKHILKIKNNQCKPYDMTFGCPGWIEALILASQLIEAGIAQRILVAGADMVSRAMDPHDRTAMIFADGAGAVVLEAREGSAKTGIINHITIADNLDELDFLVNGPSLNKDFDGAHSSVSMKGRKVYEYALRKVPAAIKRLIEQSGIDIDDVQKVLLHQANAKMDHAMIMRLFKLFGKEAPKDIDPMTIQKFGNSSVATVPTMFDLIQKGQLGHHKFDPGSYTVFASVGAGMSINAVLYKFPE
ncbi:MAG: ketoacyl-ACP synthase III [Flavobacteriaceae bacterium]|nr:ketoacyl-ACP synthase III [Flavobacteriaceae bacterium]